MSFIRDPDTKMVINTNDSHYQSILRARAAEKEANTLRDKLNNMQLQIDQIIAGNKNVKTSS